MRDPAPASFTRLYLEAVGGVAGDMLLAGLIDLGADQKALRTAFASLGLPELRLIVERVAVNGEAACYVRSLAPKDGHGRRLSDILTLVAQAELSDAARSRARTIFEVLAAAEARVHGGSAAEVHLHEVGQIDSIMDVIGISVALSSLGNPLVSAGPLPSGQGTVDTAHGTLTCPVPAVRVIAEDKGIVLSPVEVAGETVTPTGIAAVATICSAAGEAVNLESADAVGIGAGTRRFTTRPNILRIYGWQ